MIKHCMAIFVLCQFFLAPWAQAQTAGWTENGATTTTPHWVGIGTTSPAESFHIKGNQRMFIGQDGASRKGMVIGATDADVNAGYVKLHPYNYGTGTSLNLVINPFGGGSVGIGTTTPAGILDVRGIDSWFGTSAGGTRLRATGGSQAGIWLRYTDQNMYVDSDLHMTFRVNGSSSLADAMRINSSGNVGIGTMSPGSKLHVIGDITASGNITATGNIAAKYQDIAEWVSTPTPLPVGTVVVIDKAQHNAVVPSTQPYDTRVAGVVSDKPGIVLGEADPHKAQVATLGRVRVRVNATHMPIEIGDLLVTSPEAGVAMRSEPITLGGVEIHRPGTLIGKALEPLQHGEGEILVLLSLQ